MVRPFWSGHIHISLVSFGVQLLPAVEAKSERQTHLCRTQWHGLYAGNAPHIALYRRTPLTLVRCIDGTGKSCFYQKHKNEMLPAEIGSIEIVDKKTGTPEPYITLSAQKELVELAQLGVPELHPWGSRNTSLEKPDWIVFDLDPDSAIGWKTLAAAAAEVRERLKHMGLESFLKTTGGNGLHVVAPIRAENPWPLAKEFAHNLVFALEKDSSDLYLTKMTKAARKDKIYLDYLRNERSATSIAPYSPRARSRVPVAAPLKWEELKAKGRPLFYCRSFPSGRGVLKKIRGVAFENSGNLFPFPDGILRFHPDATPTEL